MRSIALLSALLFALSARAITTTCPPVPDLTIDWLGTISGCSGTTPCSVTEPINFVAKPTSGSFAACHVFDWDFGDGTHSSLRTPTHIFANPGTFPVLLSVSNGAGQFKGGFGSVPVMATVSPSVVFFRVSASTVGGGRTVDFSWNTTNTPKGIRIENVHPVSVPAVVKLSSPLSIGSTSITAMTTMSYTLTALGDASSYTTPTPITVVVVGPSKGRAVRH
jgi:PKD repeat protein